MKKIILSYFSVFVLCLSIFAADKPNILIFLVDDMGLMDTSVPFVTDERGKPSPQALNTFYRTPSMEKLAAQGVRFAHFYANSVCSPTRASLLNGQYSARHRTTQWINPRQLNAGPKGWNWEGMKQKDITLQNLLKNAGYTTMHVGKAHLGPNNLEGADPTNVGFDINIGGKAIGHPGSYYGKDNYGEGLYQVPHLKEYHGTDTFLSEALTIETKKRLTELAKEDKPFFLHMSHYALHTPFHSDPRFAQHYQNKGKNDSAQAYATLVEGMDKSLGDLMSHLEEIGEAENTLILFLGDNGSDAPLGAVHKVASSAPYRGKKGTHYEGGMRAPFMISWAEPNPDSAIQQQFPVKQGIVYDDFVSVMDIMPTILNVAGVEPPADHKLDGQELSSYMKDHQGNHKQKFLMHFPHSHRSSNYTVYREGDWKLIKHYKKGAAAPFELFNLKKDPYESKNLAADKPQQLKQLHEAMQKALEDCDAQYM